MPQIFQLRNVLFGRGDKMAWSWLTEREPSWSFGILSRIAEVRRKAHMFDHLINNLKYSLFRLRRRERHMWTDTPIAYLFSAKEDWHLLKSRAKLEQVTKYMYRSIFNWLTFIKINKAIRRAIVKRQLDPFRAFDAYDKEERGIVSLSDLQRILASMHLAFSARDYYEVTRLADPKNIG